MAFEWVERLRHDDHPSSGLLSTATLVPQPVIVVCVITFLRGVNSSFPRLCCLGCLEKNSGPLGFPSASQAAAVVRFTLTAVEWDSVRRRRQLACLLLFTFTQNYHFVISESTFEKEPSGLKTGSSLCSVNEAQVNQVSAALNREKVLTCERLPDL